MKLHLEELISSIILETLFSKFNNFSYKPCHFSTDYEVALESVCLDATTFNVLKSDRDSQEMAFVFIKSDGTKSSFPLPESRIGEFV